MPQRIEFAKLLNPRELTHLVLGHRKPRASIIFCAFIALIWVAFTAWLWLPDPLSPRDVAGHGDGIGLDCGNLPGDDPSYVECTLTDTVLGNYRKAFVTEPRFTVDFDSLKTPAPDSGTTGSIALDGARLERTSLVLSAAALADDDKPAAKPRRKKPAKRTAPAAAPKPPPDPTPFLKQHVCNVERTYSMAKLDHGQTRFIYYLLARNTGQTCADHRLGAQSRLVRTFGMTGLGIPLGGLLSVVLDLALFALCTVLIVLTTLTRRAYLWLYGSYHVRRQK